MIPELLVEMGYELGPTIFSHEGNGMENDTAGYLGCRVQDNGK